MNKQEEINNDKFKACYSGFIDEDRDVYILYPSVAVERPPLVDAGSSDRILVINFEEDNFAIYKIPLSCLGSFQESESTLWSDLTAANGYPDWDSLSAKFGNWNAFPMSKSTPLAIGGGHKGEIWSLNQTQSEDNPQFIRNMVVIDANTVRVTTDWNNYNIGDYIVFEEVEGMTQINHKQAAIKAIQTSYTTFDVQIKTLGFNAYTGAGIASKTIYFEALSKKLNPWIDQDKKLRCGWLYFYVSTSDNMLQEEGVELKTFVDIDIIIDDTNANTVPEYRYRVDCSNINNEKGTKKWVKIWINQTAKFLQFRMRNNQAGAKIQIHAMQPGLQPLGRLV
jgi:hypothetical protein